MSAQKQAVIPSDSVQCTEQEIIRLVSDQLNFKFREKVSNAAPQSYNSKVNTNLIENFSDERSMATYASNKTVEGSPVRMCYRVWSGYTKFIRQQCKKGRVVDSLLFGVFSKKSG